MLCGLKEEEQRPLGVKPHTLPPLKASFLDSPTLASSIRSHWVRNTLSNINSDNTALIINIWQPMTTMVLHPDIWNSSYPNLHKMFEQSFWMGTLTLHTYQQTLQSVMTNSFVLQIFIELALL